MGGNLGFFAFGELWGAFGIGGNFGVAFCVCGNLASLHIRNFRCAFAVCVKLRGFCPFGGTSGAFGGGFMSFGVRSSFPHFGKLGGFCRVVGT